MLLPYSIFIIVFLMLFVIGMKFLTIVKVCFYTHVYITKTIVKLVNDNRNKDHFCTYDHQYKTNETHIGRLEEC